MKSTHPILSDVNDLPGVLQALGQIGKTYSSVFALVDDGIPEHARSQFLSNVSDERILVLKGGETVKTIPSIEKVWDFLLQSRADRNALLVNLGGGALCDAGGFAASTFKRGIDFVHVPSTLLSMVDASVGGKTGINLGGIKNIVGTFTMPQAVFINDSLLGSLPQRELMSGYAEMIKHGLIANTHHLENVLVDFSELKIPTINLIKESIQIKSAIVGRDPFEQGERKLLNFGHTIGHGLESSLAEIPGAEILHGEAVATGMLAEMFISSKLLGFPKEELQRFRELLKPLTSHVKIYVGMIPDIIQKIRNDKKNESAEVGVTLLNEDGRGEWGRTVSLEMVEASLFYIINHL